RRSSDLSIIAFFLTVVIVIDIRSTRIVDDLLRYEILKELDLLAYEDDYTRPNKDDLKQLKKLIHRNETVGEEVIYSLKGLEGAINLEVLKIDYNEIDSLAPLKHLTKLHTLDLTYSPSEEHSMFGLPENRISRLRHLKKLTSLKKLHLS